MAFPAPHFFTPATVFFNGVDQPSMDISVPWHSDVNCVDDSDLVCVLTQPSRSLIQGLYTRFATPDIPAYDFGQGWKLILGFREICAATATAAAVEIVSNVDTSQSFPLGYNVWKNAALQTNAEIYPEVGGIWVVTHVPSSGGGGGGGDVTMTMSNTPGDLPATSVGDPRINVLQDGSLVSIVNTVELKTVGGQSLGLTINGLNRT